MLPLIRKEVRATVLNIQACISYLLQTNFNLDNPIGRAV